MASITELLEKYVSMQSNVQGLLIAVEKQDLLVRDLIHRVSALENQGEVIVAKAEAAAAREVGETTRELTKEFYTAITELRVKVEQAALPSRGKK